jgi:hypothetical protein
MSNALSATIGAGVGAVVGGVLTGVFSLCQGRLAAREREQARREQNLMAAFQYFDKGSQRRSIGISIIEANRGMMPEQLPMFIPVLVNQAVYLLTESGQVDAEHELRNLQRIMGLLGYARSREGAQQFAERYDDLASILKKRLEKPDIVEETRADDASHGLKLSHARLEECQQKLRGPTTCHIGK